MSTKSKGPAGNSRGARVNPRTYNHHLRKKYRARFIALGLPCHICCGRFGPIHYDEPSDAAHPLSFVIDEIRPVSRWKEFGYSSPRECAEDYENLAPAHRMCNAAKGNKVGFTLMRPTNVVSRRW